MTCSCNAKAQTLSRITISGNKMMTGGKEIILYGIGYPDPVEQVAGVGHFDNNHFVQLRSFGINTYRMPIHPSSWVRAKNTTGDSTIEQAITYAANNGMYTIIDWHTIGSPVEWTFQSDFYKTNEADTEEFWMRMAAKYKDDPRVAAYELWNEPVTSNGWKHIKSEWNQMRDWYESMVDKIRAIDPQKPIICSGLDWGYADEFIGADPVRRKNIIYSAHCYPNQDLPWDTQFGYLKVKYPILITEFGYESNGEGNYAEAEYTKKGGVGTYHEAIYKYLHDKGIGWCLWNFTPRYECNLLTDWNYAISENGKFWKSKLLSQKQADSNKLPGKGINQHSFLYAGEWDTRKPLEQSMFIVRDGKVVWKYSMPLHTPSGGNQEFDDATLLTNGNVIFSRMSGAGMVSPDKKLLWEYKAPPGTEIHSCQSIGKDRVLIMRNGNPAQAMIINTATGNIEKEIPIPTTVTGTHGQFRHIRMTRAGTILVPHMSEGKVVEYDQNGKMVWSVKADSTWSAIRLKNGNTLIAGDAKKYVREVNKKGETVWELTQADVNFKLGNLQTANRMANGNTVICSWIAGDNDTSHWAGTVQVFEVTKVKKVVWAMSSWDNPDLGPATSIHLLDEPGTLEDQQR